MTERRRYSNPPIEEALCEFHFAPGDEWDLTIPGKLHTQLEQDYPAKPMRQVVARVGLEVEGGRASGMQYQESIGKVQFFTKDNSRLVGVGPDTLSIHILRPYRNADLADRAGWDEFRGRIESALNAYWDVSAPVGVRSMGVRYINKIVIPRQVGEVSDYLNCAIPKVEGLPEAVTSFAGRVEYRYDDDVRLLLSQGLASAPPGQVAFLLDIDVIWESESYLDVAKTVTKVSELRDIERRTFETVITEKARDLFDAT